MIFYFLVFLTVLLVTITIIKLRKGFNISLLSPNVQQPRARVAVLLTSHCTKIKYEQIYRRRFEWWSKNFDHVYVVDSCGEMVIPEFHERNVCSFSQDAVVGTSSTILERESIIQALKKFNNFVGFDLVFKITAKYIFPKMKKTITYIPKLTNVLVQHRHCFWVQNSEIFAMRPYVLCEFMSNIMHNCMMERTLFQFTYKYPNTIRLPKIKIKKDWRVARGNGSKLRYL